MKNAIAALLLFGLTTVAAQAQMHAPAPMTKAQFEAAVTGSSVNLVVRVAGIKRDTLHADLLETVTENAYKTTGTAVDLFYASDTPIVMGTKDDVKPGAVLFVYATATGRNSADVKKVVVLTPYVSVK